jgi:hypothetical protein
MGDLVISDYQPPILVCLQEVIVLINTDTLLQVAFKVIKLNPDAEPLKYCEVDNSRYHRRQDLTVCLAVES